MTPEITHRQYQCIALVAQGLDNEEIGKVLFIATHTVKTHLTRLFEVLGANNRAHAVSLMWERGLWKNMTTPTIDTQRFDFPLHSVRGLHGALKTTRTILQMSSVDGEKVTLGVPGKELNQRLENLRDSSPKSTLALTLSLKVN